MDGKKKVDWTKAMEEMLIEEVKKHNFLYNPKDPLHAQRTLRTRTYLKISEIMMQEYPQFKNELTLEELSRKFAILRKYYIKEAKKAKLDPSRSTRPKKWEHTEKLSFLDEYMLIESNSKVDESADKSCDESIQDRIGVPSSSTQTLKPNKTIEINYRSKPIGTAESAIVKAAAALEKIASTMTDDRSFDEEAGVPSSSTQALKRKKMRKVETEDYVMAKAADALEKIANAQRKTPEELFVKYYSERILRIKNPMLKRRLRLELEELVSRYEEEDEELSTMR